MFLLQFINAIRVNVVHEIFNIHIIEVTMQMVNYYDILIHSFIQASCTL